MSNYWPSLTQIVLVQANFHHHQIPILGCSVSRIILLGRLARAFWKWARWRQRLLNRKLYFPLGIGEVDFRAVSIARLFPCIYWSSYSISNGCLLDEFMLWSTISCYLLSSSPIPVSLGFVVFSLWVVFLHVTENQSVEFHFRIFWSSHLYNYIYLYISLSIIISAMVAVEYLAVIYIGSILLSDV